jgi:hypothetical protein
MNNNKIWNDDCDSKIIDNHVNININMIISLSIALTILPYELHPNHFTRVNPVPSSSSWANDRVSSSNSNRTWVFSPPWADVSSWHNSNSSTDYIPTP